MTLKTARAKSRLTETESATDLARCGGIEAANEAGARGDGGRRRKGRSVSDAAAGGGDVRMAGEERDAMPYRESAADPTIGDELTRAREAAGLHLDDVAAQLRIRREFLAALEEGRPDALPGVTYAIGYVRTYAAFLGLDVEQAVTRFKQEAAGLAQRTQLVFPSPAPEGRVPGVGLVFASVLLAGLAYGGWYWMSEHGLSVHDMVPEVPERLATLIEGQTGAPPAPVSGTDVSSAPASAPATGSAGTTTDVSEGTAEGTPPPTTDLASGTTAESAYRAANPTSVPVTARSSAGDDTAQAPANAPAASPAEDAAPEAVAAAPAQQSIEPQAATDLGAPGLGAPDLGVSGLATADTTSSETAANAPVADPAPGATDIVAAPRPEAPVETQPVENQSVGVQSGPDQPVQAQDATSAPPLAAAAPEPTQALAATEPLSSPVPSAPRLSGLIGASEAAVPESGRSSAIAERVVVRATGESWVQVRTDDGTTLFTRVLRSGDVYRVPDRNGLTLATGNAGALEILVDGEPAPSLGTFGEVVRNIALDPARLADGTAIGGRN
ncbi:RodZ domain-containing protein [Thalassobaculum sp.]|uniref:helix-turn-helix domain-containing protein n=1 Tax=Thalassobaculum sp. TaxID=2022740 RepID=UPI0032EF2008